MSRPRLLSEEQISFIRSKEFNGLIDKHLVARELCVSTATIGRRLRELGIKHAQQHLIDAMRRYLLGEGVIAIAKSLELSQVTIHAFFRRNSLILRKRQYLLNDRYFESIDSEDKAYFLGFIYADGCVYKNRLRIGLSSVDLGILNRFSEAVGSNKPVMIAKQSGGYSSKSESATVELVSNDMVSDLYKLGVHPNKTADCDFPDCMLASPFLRDFIRGYWDGDGSISKYSSRVSKTGQVHTKYGVSVCGTKSFIRSVRGVLEPIVNAKGHISKRWPTEFCCDSLSYSGRVCVSNLLNYLYKNSTVYLDRKYERYLNVCT